MGVIDRAPRLHPDSSQDVRPSCGGSGQLTSWEMILTAPPHTCDTDVPNTDPAGRHCSICGAEGARVVPVVVPSYPEAIPAAPGHEGYAVEIEDTPEIRAELERSAIPKCLAWREANPEPMLLPGDSAAALIEGRPATMPAPYCCSAYCGRCIGLRALDGAKPLRPNEWMLND